MAARLTTDKAVRFILQNRLAINAVRLEREGVLQEPLITYERGKGRRLIADADLG